MLHTQEEYEQYKKEQEKAQQQVFALMGLLIFVCVIVAAALMISVPDKSIPAFLKNHWDVFPLWMGSYFLLFPLIYLSPPARRLKKKKAIYNAIAAYERAKALFAKWEKNGSKEALLQSRELALVAEPVLGELLAFQEVRSRISKAFVEVFPGAP